VTALLLLLAALAACSSPVSSPQPTGGGSTPTPAPQTSPPTALPTDEPGGTQPAGQLDTAWGPIWEILPPGFPAIAGAQPAEPDSVVSAAYAVPTSSTADARAVANEYGRWFADAGYGGAVDGPFEDGSYTTWASDGYGCDMLVTAVPRGPDEVYVTVLYGALCPFEWAE
jgi:hypothetical protein